MHSVPDPKESFDAVVRDLLDTPLRPEFQVEQAPSPGRLAPYSVTLIADAVEGLAEGVPSGGAGSVSSLSDSATGRFVVLHDPDGVEEWEGDYRVVVFAKCDVETELLADPLIHEVAWSWVTESLADIGHFQLGGTVSVSSGTSFGTMAERPGDGLVEIRASWTPEASDLGPHSLVWIDILAKLAGLPPEAPGVTTMAGRRASRI